MGGAAGRAYLALIYSATSRRISPSIFNDMHDIEALLDALS